MLPARLDLMTTATRTTWRPRWVAVFLAAIAVGVFTAGWASAVTTSAAQTRVGASASAAGVFVGPSANITAGQRLGNDPPRAEFVVATGVAAKTGAELPEGYSSFSAAKRAMGSPGEGNAFDHVVEQSQIGRSGFAPEEIHNPFDMNPVPSGVNQIKANYYSRKLDFTNGGTVRDWLSGQPFDFQYRFGMQVLSDIGAGLIQ